MAKLNARQVVGAGAGYHNDGDGLYLAVSGSGAKSWVLRTRVRGRKIEMGLGSAKWTSLAEARKAAQHYRAIARKGGDPLAERDGANGVPTFEAAARQVWEEQVLATGRNGKHKQQWLNTLRDYAFPVIGDRTVDTIRSGDVLQVLSPIWLQKAETAKRVRQRLNTVFEWCIVANHCQLNPMTGIEKALPRQTVRPRHHAALPWSEVPAIMARVGGVDGMGALALRFTILTAARSGEVRGARWSEIDRAARLWTVPAERMKAGRDHRVPLSEAALAVLDAVQAWDTGHVCRSAGLVFPSTRKDKPLSDMTLAAVLKRLEVPVTVHGFRSSFRDWCAEATETPREVAEAALAHQVGNRVEQAYARTDHQGRRTVLMEQWGAFCIGDCALIDNRQGEER